MLERVNTNGLFGVNRAKAGAVEITKSQYERIADSLPRQRGNVSMINLQVLNALLYVIEHGCKWRGLPKHFGNWHTVYTRMNRWRKAGGVGSCVCPVAGGANPGDQD
jgi:Putative transposase of IS4/5 family (DUF4096)